MTDYPNLRTHVRKGENGQTWTSYYWDGRTRGVKDVPLGTDWDRAIEGWSRCQAGILPIVRGLDKLPKARQAGKRRAFPEGMFGDLPAWAKTFYLNAERRAHESQRPFTLTVSELAGVIERAAGYCEVSGLLLDPSGWKRAYTPSVDRLDCTRGYEKDNIRIVALITNFAMNNWGEGPMMALAEQLMRKRQHQGCGSTSSTPLAA